MRALVSVSVVVLLVALTPWRGDAQRSAARTTTQPARLEHGSLIVRASRHLVWASVGGDIDLGLGVRDHAVQLLVSGQRTRLRHAFDRPTFGSGPLFVQYGTWHPESLAVRVFETAPSLGWPRFTACLRLVSRPATLRIADAREANTEFGCD